MTPTSPPPARWPGEVVNRATTNRGISIDRLTEVLLLILILNKRRLAGQLVGWMANATELNRYQHRLNQHRTSKDIGIHL